MNDATKRRCLIETRYANSPNILIESMMVIDQSAISGARAEIRFRKSSLWVFSKISVILFRTRCSYASHARDNEIMPYDNEYYFGTRDSSARSPYSTCNRMMTRIKCKSQEKEELIRFFLCLGPWSDNHRLPICCGRHLDIPLEYPFCPLA